MQKLNSTKMFASLATRVARVVANVHDYEAVTPTLARVVITANTADGTPQELAAAIGLATGHEASVVEGSFRELSSLSLPAYIGFIAINASTRVYDKETDKHMHSVNANLMVDTTDESLWRVSKSATGTVMLARENQADLSTVLASTQVRQHRAPVLASVVTNVSAALESREGRVVAQHQFVAFVDPVQNAMRYGYVCSSYTDEPTGEPMVNILVNAGLDDEYQDAADEAGVGDDDGSQANMRDGENTVGTENEIESVSVSARCIVEVAYLKDADGIQWGNPKLETAAPVQYTGEGKDMSQRMDEYYGALYSYDKTGEYYARIKEQIRNRSSV